MMNINDVQILQIGETEVTGEDVADIIWLVAQMGGDPFITSATPIVTTPPINPLQSSDTLPLAKHPLPSPTENRANLYFPDENTTTNRLSELPFYVPEAAALPNQLAIARSLRPLMRRVLVHDSTDIDEAATAKQIAEGNEWAIVYQLQQRRWLDLLFVVEESRTMAMWQQTLRELLTLLQRMGAFRTVTVYGLAVVNEDDVVKWKLHTTAGAGFAAGRPCNLRELIKPAREQLIIVATDCCSDVWIQSNATIYLNQWAKHHPVTLLQMLPKSMWDRTALANALDVKLTAAQAGLSNFSYRAEPPWYWQDEPLPDSAPFPIVALESHNLSNWTQMLTGRQKARSFGYYFIPTEKIHNNATSTSLTNQQQFENFWRILSPPARKLAGYLAAAPVLNLSIIRLIQYTMIGKRSQHIHIAELLYSGLLVPFNTDNAAASDNLKLFDFILGANMRSYWLDTVGRSTKDVILHRVSRFINFNLNNVSVFMATLRFNVSDHKHAKSSIISQAFAQIAPSILKSLGGRYLHLLENMQASNLDNPQNTPIINDVNTLDKESQRTILNVPFAEKDEAKRLGARWDQQLRKWYVPHGIDERDFEKWIPEHALVPITREDVKFAWQNYNDLLTLSHLRLVLSTLCQSLLWAGDEGANAGYSVRAVLYWAMKRLAASKSSAKQNNAAILEDRFVSNYSVAQTVELHDKDEQYVQRRQRTAWKQTTDILESEQTELRGEVERAKWVCAERFKALDGQGKKLLKFMAVFDLPIPPNYLIYHDNQLPYLLDANMVQWGDDRHVQVHPRIVAYVRDLLTRAEQEMFHTQAGDLYAEGGHVLLAAMQWQAAGRWQAAADILINNRHKIGDFDTLHTLNQWQAVLRHFAARQLTMGEDRAKINLMLGNAAKMTDAPLQIALEAYQQAIVSATTSATHAEIYYERGHALQEYDARQAILQLETCCSLSYDPQAIYWVIKAQLLLAWLHLVHRNDLEEGRRWLMQAEQGLVDKVGRRWEGLRADWHNTWSEHYKYMQEFAKMLRHSEQAVILAERSGDPLRIVKMTYQLGAAYHQNGSAYAQRAREMLEQCEKWATQMGYDVMIGKIQNIWGATSFERQAYDEALQHYQQAEKVFHDAGEKRSYAATQYNQAEVLFASGNAMQALEMMNNGHKIAQASGNQTLSDWFEPRLRKMYIESREGLNMRQRKAIHSVRENGKMTKKQYCSLNAPCSEATARRDLDRLMAEKIFERHGKGRGTYYILS